MQFLRIYRVRSYILESKIRGQIGLICNQSCSVCSTSRSTWPTDLLKRLPLKSRQFECGATVRSTSTSSKLPLNLNSWGILSQRRHASSTLYTPPDEANHAPFVLKPDIDFERIFGDLSELESNVEARGRHCRGVVVPKLVALYKKLQMLEQEKICIEDRRSKVKKEIRNLRKGGANEGKDEQHQMGRALREELRQVNAMITSVSNEFYPAALKVPNQLHQAVPRGATGKILETFGTKPGDKKGKSMEELHSQFVTESHPLAHAGYAYLEHDATLIEFAITQWAKQQLLDQGFVPFVSPAMYKAIALEAFGLNAEDSEAYAVETHENVQYLVGASPLAFIAYLMMSVMEADDLPYRSFTVGRSYNSHLESTKFKGLHLNFQTQKVELCGMCENTDSASNALFTQFLNTTKNLLSKLPLHYRVVEVPSASLLPSVHRKCAVEVWIPNSNMFTEVASVSSCTDYISRRVKMRYPAIPTQKAVQSRQRNFLHTVHCTALNSGVLMAALLPDIYKQVPDILETYIPRAVRYTDKPS